MSLAEDEEPSCSVRELLERQGLFVNDGMTVLGFNLIGQLLIGGSIRFFIAVFSVRQIDEPLNPPIREKHTGRHKVQRQPNT